MDEYRKMMLNKWNSINKYFKIFENYICIIILYKFLKYLFKILL